MATTHCETAPRLSGRLSLPDSVSGAVHALFERWDGSGFPDGLAGGQIPVPARFAQFSYDALLLHEHLGGISHLAGLPANSIPALASGLPTGVQIVAPAGGEHVILCVAAELECLRPWPQLAPMAAVPRHR